MDDVTNESGLREKIARALHADFGRVTQHWARMDEADKERWLKQADRILALISPAGEVVPVPFAYFQFNEAWGSWEQVVPEAANRPGVIAAYRSAAPRGMEG